MLTEADRKKRSAGVGSSEAAMVIYVEDGHGDSRPLSPWGGKHTLWRRKTGRDSWDKETDYMRRGTFLEAGLIEWYAADHGIPWYKPSTITHPIYPYVVDSADGISFAPGTPKKDMKKKHPRRVIEAKVLTGFDREGWGSPGTDEIPDHYLIQSMWHIGAHQPEEMSCDFPIDLDCKRLDYVVTWDEELYQSVLLEVERFWVDHVQADKEPEIDNVQKVSKWLSGYLKQREGMGLLAANDDQVKLLLDYRSLVLQGKAQEEALTRMQIDLQRAIGEYDGIEIPGSKARISWKQPKDKRTIDWKAVADDLAARLRAVNQLTQEQHFEVIDNHTRAVMQARRWCKKSLLTNAS